MLDGGGERGVLLGSDLIIVGYVQWRRIVRVALEQSNLTVRHQTGYASIYG